MSSYVTIAPDGSREVDVQSLFYDQIEMVRRIARMEQVLNTVMISAEEYAELKGYAKEAGATLGKLHAAQQRIAELEAERDAVSSRLSHIDSNLTKAKNTALLLVDERDRLIDELRDAEARNAQKLSQIARLREALTELVNLKDLKTRIQHYEFGSTQEIAVATEDYDKRKPLAWNRARAALESGDE